jgi:hypothetical protein
MVLVIALDCMESNCDLEDGADAEPWLVCCERGPQTVFAFHDGKGSPYHDREREYRR